jgi:acyl-CoA thioesterase-1
MMPERRRLVRVLSTVALLLTVACRGSAPDPSKAAAPARSTTMTTTTAGALVAFLGDSLTAGWNLDEEQAYPALVEQELRSEGRPIRVLNAGVSGDTSAGALRRLGWVLKQKPDVVVVAIGANDGLRGLDLAALESNVREILADVAASGSRALLVGMKIPPSLGPDYARRFESIYPRLARERHVPLVPFLLEGVAGRTDLTFPDGVHPTAAGHERLAQTVLPFVRDMLTSARS